MERGRRWTIQDRIGNRIYLTDERWSHIIDPTNHPELAGLEAEVQETIRTGQRKQDALNPQKYRYSKAFGHLPEDNTHVVVIVSSALRAETIRTGQRKQDALNPQKYRYSKAFGHLPEDNTHVVVIVLFRYAEGPDGKPIANNYIVTAYLKEVG
jgi:hypothetical protein